MTLKEEALYLCNIENKLNGRKYKLLQMSHIFRARKEDLSNDELSQHEHAFCELFFVTNGTGKMMISGEEIPIEKGDLLVIHDTGAHGFSMGYNYNGRLRSAELLLKDNGEVKMIRRAETPADYFATFDFTNDFSFR